MYRAALVLFIAPLCMGQNVVLHSQPLPVAPPPPQPYNYAYSAARVPGASPDRYASQQGDELGVVRGQYAYLDPNYKWQQVQYVADDEGFHVDSSNLPVANVDTPAVANAKANHAALFQQIAASHTLGAHGVNAGVVIPVVGPQDSAAVAQAKAQHAALFGRIAASNSQAPVAIVRQSPPETPIVQDYRNRFSEEFARIAEEHARIAEEHAIMAEQEAREREIAEGKPRATN